MCTVWSVHSESPGYTSPGYTLPITRVQALLDVAARRGWDVASMMDEAGISLDLLAQGRARVTLEQITSLFNRLWRTTDDELLGFGLRPVPLGTFRLLCFGLISAPTLRAAIQRAKTFHRSLPGLPPLEIVEVGDEARLEFDISAIAVPVDILVDILLLSVHRYIAWGLGQRMPLRRVEVPYPAVPDNSDYDLIFGAQVRFSAPRPALVFGADLLDAPLVRDEDELLTFLSDVPAAVLTRTGTATTVTGQVRRLLERGLTGEWPSVDDLAADLAMSPQTLRRKLREEGTSSREIKERILRDAAVTSLVRGEETIAALSRRLGFSEPSAFSRAFSRWTGDPPSAYQR
ncbi:AraC family transcriptional regulator [Skermania sp. ID1734]|nr:AraC family transcriptional regulator [Skermania sp. ID1734]